MFLGWWQRQLPGSGPIQNSERRVLVRPFQNSRAAPGTLRRLRRKFCDGSSWVIDDRRGCWHLEGTCTVLGAQPLKSPPPDTLAAYRRVSGRPGMAFLSRPCLQERILGPRVDSENSAVTLVCQEDPHLGLQAGKHGYWVLEGFATFFHF